MRFEGKKAIVIGGTTGMGAGTAEVMRREGVDVLVTGSNERNLEAARARGLRTVRSDLADLDSTDHLRQYVEREFGSFDLLFVNAGVSALAPVTAVTVEDYDRQFTINTRGPYFTVQKLLPFLHDGGSIVFTASVTNLTGSGGMSVYSGTKAALHAFAKVLAAELLPRGIRVNTISPGFIRTESMGAGDLTAEERAAFEKIGDEVTPMGRHGSIEEIAAAVLFLGFEATFTTGVELPVTGGLGQSLAAY